MRPDIDAAEIASVVLRRRRCLAFYLSALFGLMAPAVTVADQETASGTAATTGAAAASEIEFFESKIRPILVNRCQKCHGSDKQQGGLRLDSRAGWTAGGDQGAAIIPGKPGESLLIRAVRHKDADFKMPPDARLAEAEVNALVEWIRRGAPDPRTNAGQPGAATTWEQSLSERSAWWCWQPVRRPEVPAVKATDWPANPIDRFLLARMEAEGLAPCAPADLATLARRLSFVLTGLPPESGGLEVAGVDRLVDQYLASPHFGEQWTRHWMDLVKYGDSHGSEHDPIIPHAWQYRDYLVRAFNSDLPYNQFVREHLAGDTLPPRWNAALGLNESPLATGFFRFVEFYPTPIDVKNEEISVIESQIDAFGKTFQGLTIACARCHDHKFDAISARDFQALFGVFSSTRTTMHRLDDPMRWHVHDGTLVELKRAIRRELAGLWREQLAYWPSAIVASRDGAFVRQPGEAGADPPGTRSFEAETERWQAALLKSADRPADPLWPLAQVAKRCIAQCPEANAGCNTHDIFGQVSDAWCASIEQRGLKLKGRFRLFADFSSGTSIPPQWTTGEAPLANDWYAADNFHFASVSGDFAVEPTGSNVVTAIFPRGRYSHLVCNKHGGTFRSPNFELTMKFISVLAGGTNDARVRLVIENFQGDQVLFTVVMPKLKEPRLQWFTFPVREVWVGRRAYLEVIPRDEMPYPGITPDTAALMTDGRSGLGIRCVVFHEESAGPELISSLPEEFWQVEPTWPAMAAKVTALARAAIDTWSEECVTDEQAQFVDGLLRSGVLLNRAPVDHELARLLAQYREIEAQIPVPSRGAGVADEAGFDERFFPRGDYRRAGDPVPRRYLEVLEAPDLRSAGSGRRALADALVSPRNPLTARVMVNRLWHHVYGVGLVKTVDNFGRLGDPPSHPELLDWLAAEFVESGWSIKHMLRLMVTARAFQCSAAASLEARERDPDNRLLSHASVRRLPAESIRDALLAVSGRLNRRAGGRGIPLPMRENIRDFAGHVNGPSDGDGRRSLYLEARRNYPQALLAVFDQPKPVLTVGQRNVTSVPAQSLALLNDPFVWQQAELFGQRFAAAPSVEARIDSMIGAAFGREPLAAEVERALQFIQSQAELLMIEGEGWRTDARVWTELAHALFNLKEFVYLR